MAFQSTTDLELSAAALKMLFYKQRFSVFFQPCNVLQELLPAAKLHITDQHSLHFCFTLCIFGLSVARKAFLCGSAHAAFPYLAVS